MKENKKMIRICSCSLRDKHTHTDNENPHLGGYSRCVHFSGMKARQGFGLLDKSEMIENKKMIRTCSCNDILITAQGES